MKNELNEKLINSARIGDVEEVKKLLEEGADVHADDDWALCWAASFGHAETVKLLIEAGVDDYCALRWARLIIMMLKWLKF